jgi:hypothetical protein
VTQSQEYANELHSGKKEKKGNALPMEEVAVEAEPVAKALPSAADSKTLSKRTQPSPVSKQ